MKTDERMSAGDVAALEKRVTDVLYGGESGIDVFYARSDRAEKLPALEALREHYYGEAKRVGDELEARLLAMVPTEKREKAKRLLWELTEAYEATSPLDALAGQVGAALFFDPALYDKLAGISPTAR
jgi:hypothetical protein